MGWDIGAAPSCAMLKGCAATLQVWGSSLAVLVHHVRPAMCGEALSTMLDKRDTWVCAPALRFGYFMQHWCTRKCLLQQHTPGTVASNSSGCCVCGGRGCASCCIRPYSVNWLLYLGVVWPHMHCLNSVCIFSTTGLQSTCLLVLHLGCSQSSPRVGFVCQVCQCQCCGSSLVLHQHQHHMASAQYCHSRSAGYRAIVG